MKSLERLTMDISGMMFLLPAIMGLAAGFSGKPVAYFIAALVFIFIEILFGMVITMTNFALARFFPASTVRNIVQISNVLILVLIFALFYPTFSSFSKYASFQEIAGEPIVPDWVNDSGLLKTGFRCFPLYWLVRGFYEIQTSYLAGAAWCTAFMLFCLLLWGLCLKAGKIFQTLGWTYQAEEKPGAGSSPEISIGTGILKGIIRKDLRLLKRDKGFMVNGLVVPLAFFFFYGYMLIQRGTPKPVETLSFLTMGIMYFHYFGAINSVGFEKKAVWVLRSLPLSPRRVMVTKSLMWSVIAAAVYIILFLAIAVTIGFSAVQTLAGTAWLLFIAVGVAHLGVAISVLYPNFEARFLQGGSTGGGKILMAALTLPLVGIMLIGRPSVITGSVAVFSLMAWAIFLKAEDRFRYLDETEELPTPAAVMGDAFMYLYFFFILNSVISLILHVTIFKQADGMTIGPVALLISSLLMGIFIIRYFRKHSQSTGITLRMAPAKLLPDLALGLGFACVLLAAVYPYLHQVKWMNLPLDQWKWTLFVVALVVAPVWEEVFFRGFLHTSILRVVPTPLTAAFMSAMVFALMHPPVSIPAAFLLGLISAWLIGKRKTLFPSIVLHVAYNVGVLTLSMWL